MRQTFIVFFLLITYGLFAQDVKKIEQDLVIHFKKIDYWSTYNSKDEKINPVDSLQKANEVFQHKLLEYASRQPLTLRYGFGELRKELITIATSADKKFRIYSWDTRMGGTMHFFNTIYQYEAGNKVISGKPKKEEGDSGGWFSEIFQLGNNGKSIYMGYFHAIYSTKDVYQAIKFFTINNNKLVEARLLKTRSGLIHEVGFEFDLFSVVDRKERPVKLIYFDSTRKTLKIPVVTTAGEVTRRFLVYKFNGKFFEYQGR